MDSSTTFSLVFFAICLAVIAFYGYCGWKIFEKAGQPGWAAIIPVYGHYTLTKIIGKPWWWTILMLIPYLSVIWNIWSINLLSKSFGKDTGFTVGMVFLWFVFIPILAFDKSIQYQGPAANPGANLGDQIQSIGADVR